MTKRFSLPRLLGVLAAISCTCATLAIAAQVAPRPESAPPDASGVIILDIAAPEKGDMPPVAFDHIKHTPGPYPGETCANCHEDGMVNTVKRKAGNDLKDAYHDACLTCHTDVKSKGEASPPQKAECRSCHDASALPAAKGKTAQGKTVPQRMDGGFDASLHAKHVASDTIIAMGDTDTCATCHHATKVPFSLPNLKADSCRSCHPAAPGARGAEKAPPYSEVAHATCISCHASFDAKGENLPLTCDSCHSAVKKAGYAKLRSVPRLAAGQPDTILLGGSSAAADRGLPPAIQQQSVPGASRAQSTQQQPAMAPVVFDHKLHEASVDTCRTCHMPTGKGVGVVTVNMHKAETDLSCMNCHNRRKMTKAECAGCHAIMPQTKATEARCESCHKPVKSGAVHPPEAAMQPVEYLPMANPPMQAPMQAPMKAPALPAGALEKAALEKAPASISIGTLAKEYEPSVFPHKRVVESLISGMEHASPGMTTFHSAPYALCASCHHNGPPSATPPSCASCHSKTGTNTAGSSPTNTTPSLQAAYHRQCISCHTAMNIKPAATDCAGCHTKRVTPGKGER